MEAALLIAIFVQLLSQFFFLRSNESPMRGEFHFLASAKMTNAASDSRHTSFWKCFTYFVGLPGPAAISPATVVTVVAATVVATISLVAFLIALNEGLTEYLLVLSSISVSRIVPIVSVPPEV